jgi:intracellular septation protein
MEQTGWLILTKRLALFFAVLAVLNEVIWRGFSTEVWVNFKTFGLTAALFLFFMTQSRLFAKYGIEKPKDDA